MGKIFSWREVADGRVPKLQSFDDVLEKLKIEAFSTADILGCLVLGSMLTGNYNQRSDLDCLVVYDHDAESEVISRLNFVHEYAARHFVPLSVILIDQRLAATRYHHIDPLFARHLQNMAGLGGVIKKDPLSFFNFGEAPDPQAALDSYLRFKLRTLGDGLIGLPQLSGPPLFKYLQRMLEAPIHVARKILAVDKGVLIDDGKTAVREEFLQYLGFKAGEFGLPQLFRKLLDLDAWYTSELLRHSADPDERSYGRLISKLRSAAPDYYRFVRQSAMLLIR